MKRLYNLTIFVPLVLAALLCLPNVVLGQRDTVRILGGKPSSSGAVTGMTKDSVTVNRNGVDHQIPVNTILRIQFDSEPTDVSQARLSAESGRYKDAIADLNDVNPNDIGSKYLKQDIAYYLAFCVAKQAINGVGDKGAAHDQLFGFVRENPSSFHFYQAAEVLGDLAVSKGDYPGAAKFYGGLGTAPWKDYQLKAKILRAGALVADKKFKEAYAIYQEVLDTTANTPLILQQKLHASVGKAVCLAAVDPEQGIQLVEKVIADNDPNTDKLLFARAYNALGACHLQLKQPKEALMAYLHTHLLYYGDPQLHADSLHYLEELWKQVGKPDRALQARSLLRSRYPGSAWNN